MNKADSKTKKPSVQTTGHAWDGDIQEYNNPVPTWWTWTFYGSVVFCLVYWLLFPSFPVGTSYLTGVFNTITFKNDKGEDVTTHWNTRSRFIADQQTGEMAMRQKAFMDKVAGSEYSDILQDPDKMAFVRSTSKVLFADNCAACHGSGGAGVVGLFPNLADDDWLWGGSVESIEHTLSNGRLGFMPAFAQTFDAAQLESVAHYVLKQSGESEGDAAQIAQGEKLFNGEGGGCYYCHGTDAKGLSSQGSANLTDQIWTVANVPAAANYDAKLELVKQVVNKGINREMPSWKERLSPEQIKMLTVYIHQLGGGT